MAKYEHLKIFKKAWDTTIYFENIVKNFSGYKETICIKNSIQFVTISQIMKPSNGPIIRNIKKIYKKNKRELI